jgi:hypothetical protein
LLGYALYFILIHSHALWQSPTLVQDHWKKIFYPFVALFPGDWIRPNRGSDIGYLAVALYIVLLAFLFFVYVKALKEAFKPGSFTASDRGKAFRRIFFVTVAVLAVLFIVPGVLSTDLFSYIWYGRIYQIFGANPFVQVPGDYAWHDPTNWLQWVYWKETPSVYGPLWVQMAGLVAAAAQGLGGDIVFHVLGHKVLADLAHLLNVVLVWKIAGLVVPRYWTQPRKLPAGVAQADWESGMQIAVTLLYAWNPLMLLEFGANGHNDILMLTLVLAALWLHLTGRWRLAMVAFAMAALIKFIALIFIPGYLWLLFWQAAPGGPRDRIGKRIWVAAQAVVLLAVTLVVGYMPFWEGLATLRPLISGPPVELYVNSLGDLVRFKVPEGMANLAQALNLQPPEFWTQGAIGARIDEPVRMGATIIVATVAIIQTWKARTFPTMVVAWGWVLLTYLTVGAVWFWPWYVGWLVVVVALIGPGTLLNASLILSGTSMLLYATYWNSDPTIMHLQTWKALIIQGPPLAYMGFTWLRQRRQQRTVPVRPARRAPERRIIPDRVPEAVPVPVAPQPRSARLRATPDFGQSAYGGSTGESYMTGDSMDY